MAGNTAGGQVDLNVIPTGLLDRIETIQAGGSAVYGSDAVAGVINIITKTDYEGVEIDGQFGISSRDDAQNYRARIIGGHRFLDDKLQLMGSYEYNETSPLPSPTVRSQPASLPSRTTRPTGPPATTFPVRSSS